MWGDWPALAEATSEGARLEANAPADMPAAGEIEAALRAWRREHGLIAANEMRAWLAARGLSVADVRGHLRRRALRERAAAPGSPPPDQAIAGIDRFVLVDALCSGTARAIAQRLAECGAAADAIGGEAKTRTDLGERAPLALAAGRELGIAPRPARARGERVAALELALEQLRRRLLTPEALGKELDS